MFSIQFRLFHRGDAKTAENTFIHHGITQKKTEKNEKMISVYFREIPW